MNKPLLTIEDLSTQFALDEGTVRAVDGVNLVIPRGGTVGIVGESGCGKSITALSILRLIAPPGHITGGKITLHRESGDVDITALPENSEELRRIRGGEIAMIFQEPMTAFSPVHSIGNQLQEAVLLHSDRRGKEAHAHVVATMTRAGIPDAARRFGQYPHEMSGGLLQRSMIAMGIACNPTLLIADEPTTALDVTIQAQIMEVLRELQRETNMALLLITHDLGVVAEMAETVAVMYLGRIVELAPVVELFADPQHPYTRALLRSIPGRGPRKRALEVITGGVPDPFTRLPGCPFCPRCREAVPATCDLGDRPPLHEVKPGHYVACGVRGDGRKP